MQPAAAYVTKRGRHKQLINASVLDRVTLQRKQAIDDSQQRKLLATDQWERQRMYQYVETLEALPTSSGSTHKIEIDGLKFQILKGGSKLARIPGQHLFWPKKLLMLIYYRYIRRNATNTEEDNRSWCPLCTEQARQPLPVWDCQGQRVSPVVDQYSRRACLEPRDAFDMGNSLTSISGLEKAKKTVLCKRFTKTGIPISPRSTCLHIDPVVRCPQASHVQY